MSVRVSPLASPHKPHCGVGVAVAVGVTVGVDVGVPVGVAVGVTVGVAVTVVVGVTVAVGVTVGVGPPGVTVAVGGGWTVITVVPVAVLLPPSTLEVPVIRASWAVCTPLVVAASLVGTFTTVSAKSITHESAGLPGVPNTTAVPGKNPTSPVVASGLPRVKAMPAQAEPVRPVTEPENAKTPRSA